MPCYNYHINSPFAKSKHEYVPNTCKVTVLAPHDVHLSFVTICNVPSNNQ